MQQSKPISYIFKGSVILTTTSFLILLVSKIFFFNLTYRFIIFCPIVIGILSFSIFYFYVGNILKDRLSIISKLISFNNITEQPKINLTQNTLNETEDLVRNWAQKRAKEIETLKEQEKFRRDFIGNLAHELKTPIFAIQGYVETLLDGAINDPKVNTRFLERTVYSVDRMINLLNELDQITYFEAGKVKLELSKFNIIELIKETKQSLELKAEGKNVTIELVSKENNIEVYADRNKIGQVLTNLIQNSITYGKENGTTKILLFPMDQLLLVEISDNGMGIAEENLNRIFERFYRVEESRSRNEGGSGLGLVITKNILDSHKQTISVRSAVGMGSTFTFSLQLASSIKNSELITSHGLKVR